MHAWTDSKFDGQSTLTYMILTLEMLLKRENVFIISLPDFTFPGLKVSASKINFLISQSKQILSQC